MSFGLHAHLFGLITIKHKQKCVLIFVAVVTADKVAFDIEYEQTTPYIARLVTTMFNFKAMKVCYACIDSYSKDQNVMRYGTFHTSFRFQSIIIGSVDFCYSVPSFSFQNSILLSRSSLSHPCVV